MPRDLVVTYDGDTAGADAAAAKTRADLSQTGAAAEAMSKQFQSSMGKAAASGKNVGKGVLKSVTEAAGSSILKGAGGTIGTALTNAIGRKLATTDTFKALQAKAQTAGKAAGDKLATGLTKSATTAGKAAGAKVATGVERSASKVNWSKLRTPALVAAALGAGILFGRRFGNSAERQAMASFQPKFQGLRTLGKGLFTGLAASAGAAGLAAGAVLGGAIAKGGARLDAIDSARGKLSGLGHDAKAVDKIMQDALASVKGTAFGLDEAATVSATSVAAGIKPGKDLQRTLKLIADTATIGNTSLSESGAIFNKVATSNKVYNDTLNQLGDRGIPIVQLLGKQMGKSSDEVTKLASKGKIDFKTFQAALEGGLGGAALKSGDTFQGALKNSKAALGRFGAGLLKGVFPQLKGVFGDVTKGLDGLGPTAERIGKKAGKVFADLVGLAKALGPTLKTVGALASGALDPFVESLGGGKGAIKSLTDYVSTHQEDLTGFFLSAGHAAIGFGKGAAGVAVVVLTAYAGLQKGVQAYLESTLGTIQATLGAAKSAASALGLDDVAAKLGTAAEGVQKLRDNNKTSNSGDAALGIAKNIKDNLLPALDKADAGLTKTGKTQAFKAAQRDAAAKTANAIRDIGTASDGSQLKLKKWSDVSKLGAAAQGELRGNIKRAQSALRGQIDAQQAAGAGQKALTKTWQRGKDRLAEEFQQMGLSRREAGRLAAKYAGVKPKVKTKFETPGLPGAKSGTDNYKGSLKDVPGKKTTKFQTPGLNDAYNRARSLDSTLRNLPKNIQIKVNQSVATKGDRLAADRATGGVWNGPDRVIKAASGRVLPGFTPGRDVHRFYSATAGQLNLSGGEAIMRPEFTRAVGGAPGVDRLNRESQDGTLARRLAEGGIPALSGVPTAPSTSAPSARASTATAVVDPRMADVLAAAVREAVAGLAIELGTDSRGIMSLVDARIVEQNRKRKN